MQRIIIFGTCIVLGLGVITGAVGATLPSNGATFESHVAVTYNVSNGATLELEIPEGPSEGFDERFYDIASQKMMYNARKLTTDQRNDFTNLGQALDASMAAQIKRMLGLDDDSISSSDLEILLRGRIRKGDVSTLQVIFEKSNFQKQDKENASFSLDR